VPGVIFHTDQGSEGEFNRSSQHLHVEVGEWGDRGMGGCSGGAAGDAFAGAASGGQAGTPAAVLGGDRQGNAE
jgi:putative transposase